MITVHPGQVEGRVRAPGSKSITHRALFLTGLCGGGTVHHPLWSRDTLATRVAVRPLGARVLATRNEAVVRASDPTGGRIDAQNSGTTLRLATALAATVPEPIELTGDASLVQRPMGPLIGALEQLGATIECLQDDDRAPLRIDEPAQGGRCEMAGDVSSQFVSGLLLAGTRMPDGLELTLTSELTSRPYVDLTIRMMRRVGLHVGHDGDTYTVEPQRSTPHAIHVPGDYSGAAFPLVAACLTGGTVTVANLPPDTGQGDERLLPILERFGARIERDGDTVTVTGADLEGCEVDLGDNPDLFPVLAVLATGARGETVLRGAPHLRHKESDRIAAMGEGLLALGAEIEPTDEGAIVRQSQLRGGKVQDHDDHRVQMALAVAALAADGPVTIDGDAGVHAVSYPHFVRDLRDMGIQVELQGGRAT